MSFGIQEGTRMYDAVEFRQRAQHCIRQANEPGLARSQQTVLRRMAAKWHELAEDADRINALLGDAMTAASGRPHLDS